MIDYIALTLHVVQVKLEHLEGRRVASLNVEIISVVVDTTLRILIL